MHPILRTEFNREMALARDFYTAHDYRRCFNHLERAHVFGQLLRLAVAGIGSLIGRAPLGNTGGANVGILTPMPIAKDLAEVFRKAGM